MTRCWPASGPAAVRDGCGLELAFQGGPLSRVSIGRSLALMRLTFGRAVIVGSLIAGDAGPARMPL